jgi:hypothetical protein
LESAAKGDDPEIAARARDLLRDVPKSADAGQPEADETLPMILQYRTTPQEVKRDIIGQFSRTPAGLRALTRIWLTEADPDMRGAVFDQLITVLPTSTAALIGDGNTASAELLLQAAVDRKNADSPRTYAAYWLAHGRLDDAIRKWSSRGGHQPADTWAEQVLTALYRAKGDSRAAIVHARAAEDPDILRDTLLWAGDWPALATKLRKEITAPQEPRDLALLCGADSLAGDEKELDDDIARLTALGHGDEHAGTAGDILLLINRPDAAVKLLNDERQYYAAYEILNDRGRFDEAEALLAAHDAETTQDALLLRGSAAKDFARLGLKKRCTEMAERLAKENAVAKSPRVYVSLAEAERAIGLTDKAWEHFLPAIESSGENGLQQWYVARAFPPRGNAVDWSGIWTASLANNPRPANVLFDRIRRAYDKTMSLDDLSAVVEKVAISLDINHPYVDLVADVGRRLRAAGKETDAIKLVEEMAQEATEGDLYACLGDWAAEKGDWQTAETRYETAWKKNRTRALPLYLWAHAQEHNGHPAEARERIALAHQLSVGDEFRLAEVIRGLLDHGMDDDAAREADVLIRTGSPLSSSSQEALRSAAALADDHGDFAVAAALWQRVQMDYLAGSYWFETHSQYLHLPNTAADSRARAMVTAGDWAGARLEIKACMDMCPIDSSIAIDVVPELDKAGKHAEADALFDKMFAVEEAVCQKFPDSTFQLNECAWLAAKCNRRLDKAIARARRAVELDPGTGPDQGVDAIDTLAEAYFRHGDFKLAVIEERKCVALAPTVIFHKKQLARFEAGEKASNAK